MKHSKIDELVERIKALETELEAELQSEYETFACEITKKREELLESYRRDREGMLRYLATTPVLHYLTVPIIWACLIPALFLDLVVTLYQTVCFPVYKIAKVRRSDYIVIDRHRLGYLNVIEKINCVYCGYFNGLMGYVGEIAGRTEQYWCPIRHATGLKSMHSRYKNFFEYGDSAAYRHGLDEVRKDLENGS